MKSSFFQKYLPYLLGLALGVWILYQMYAFFFPAEANLEVYWENVHQAQEQQLDMGLRFCESQEPDARNAVVTELRQHLYQHITESMFPAWYNTEYDFNGTTQVPRQGKIACGYFVTTILEQAGLQLDRVALARAASEQMIQSLLQEQHIYRFSRRPLSEFLDKAKELGEGLYLVGLDTHTGFLWNNGRELYFVHASGRSPHCVIKELAETSWSLQKSKYRVLGSLTADYLLLVRWLRQRTCPLEGD